MHENGIFEDIRNAAAEDAAEAAAVEAETAIAETTPVVEVAPEVVAEEPAKPVKAKAKKATK